MTQDNEVLVDLEVSGTTARTVASTVLSEVERDEYDGMDVADIHIKTGETTIDLAVRGSDTDEVVPALISGVEWTVHVPDSISVRLVRRETANADEPHHDRGSDVNDRLRVGYGEWDTPDSHKVDGFKTGTQKHRTLAVLSDVGEASTADLQEHDDLADINPATIQTGTSKLFHENGVVDRKPVKAEDAGKHGAKWCYVYRVNSMGESLLDRISEP